jgi:hypothetical protein
LAKAKFRLRTLKAIAINIAIRDGDDAAQLRRIAAR